MPRSPRPSSQLPELSTRELEVAGLLSEGISTADIATKLFISPATVRNHIQNVLTKTGTHSRLEAVSSMAAGVFDKVQPSTKILQCLLDAGVEVSSEQQAMIHDEFTCTHECTVHPHVPV